MKLNLGLSDMDQIREEVKYSIIGLRRSNDLQYLVGFRAANPLQKGPSFASGRRDLYI